MAEVMLGQHSKKPIQPATKLCTFNTMNELFKFIEPEFYGTEPADAFTRLYNIIEVYFKGSDPFFDERDLRPFIMMNFV